MRYIKGLLLTFFLPDFSLIRSLIMFNTMCQLLYDYKKNPIPTHTNYLWIRSLCICQTELIGSYSRRCFIRINSSFKISGSSFRGFTVFFNPLGGEFHKQNLPKGQEFDRIFSKSSICRGSARPPHGSGNNWYRCIKLGGPLKSRLCLTPGCTLVCLLDLRVNSGLTITAMYILINS